MPRRRSRRRTRTRRRRSRRRTRRRRSRRRSRRRTNLRITKKCAFGGSGCKSVLAMPKCPRSHSYSTGLGRGCRFSPAQQGYLTKANAFFKAGLEYKTYLGEFPEFSSRRSMRRRSRRRGCIYLTNPKTMEKIQMCDM